MEVTINEATTQLPQLVERAMTGEDIVIADAGKPMVRLVRVEGPANIVNAPAKRILGAAKGLVKFAPDWDAPMTDDELDLFHAR